MAKADPVRVAVELIDCLRAHPETFASLVRGGRDPIALARLYVMAAETEQRGTSAMWDDVRTKRLAREAAIRKDVKRRDRRALACIAIFMWTLASILYVGLGFGIPCRPLWIMGFACAGACAVGMVLMACTRKGSAGETVDVVVSATGHRELVEDA